MSKRERMTGKERREQRRRARETPLWLRRAPLVALVAGTPIAIALILILFVLDGDEGGGGPDVEVVPTVQVSSPVPVSSPGPDTPPALDAEPTITDSGLGIIDVEEGTGEPPAEGQIVVVHYTGWLSEEGTKFDSSLDRGAPFEFTLGAGNVIAGWEEGLATMKVAGKRRLIIPADLAYGEAGRPPTIPESAELTFDVELLEIKDAQEAP
jgi:peptidylprolyl isomerase